MEQRFCHSCKIVKPISNFILRKDRNIVPCKECKKLYDKIRYEKNKEKIKN